MITNMTSGLDFQAKALVLRAERQRVIASNIANADTPGYVARDLNFKDAMLQATGADRSSGLRTGNSNSQGGGANGMTHPNHIALSGGAGASLGGSSHLAYTVQSQPSLDGNSVDLDRERANFTDNAVRYEATLRFINGQSKTLLSAIQGQ
ncbi:flagellar basal body rod protein FlgB [Rhodoferax ferrireducens]|uniref:flagellar basal body rod protein FlgB n=1 Tax=Rhodoferax ferrireducens TaxID=192843 RepID=UPI00298EBA24|nr:flagellar basal body rod protein FlgB [Rhodoferax ferrireducens]WPC66494.1 flagellar basal body rod protein FlgB [Rhodoferax ferrireducens]